MDATAGARPKEAKVALADDQPQETTLIRRIGIAQARPRGADRVRMIAADNGRPAGSRSPVCGKQRGRIDFEAARRVGRDVLGVLDGEYRLGRSEQKATDFLARYGIATIYDRADEVA